MEKLIPFNIWYNDLEELLSIVNKSNLEVLKYANSYVFGNFKFTTPMENLYKFTISRNASQFNPPPPPPPSLSSNVGLASFGSTFKQDLISYSVSLTFTKDFMVKLEVTENWSGTFEHDKNIHSIIFDKDNILVNGNWYKVDSPEPFMNDISEDDISILAVLDVMSRFNPQ
ncbi:hypothetical protein pEaSNUABM47_00340 [Erwinia phage pEa_SNUABM_47]|uniref:Uncharacterized protein n=1 Tax=Erwinia phage pEa_SNUABM_47 TaxID=2768774 RepID=A0A7L8ZMX8_9CAUD|nr:hypothetical protein pEaSNUABM47_00340 [Erwinia phage pEa_SNUABM_47]QXO12590.1 hypothetical protein pEaSNUABM49_00344 [Erwinia phage pEa_SNUABM_49]